MVSELLRGAARVASTAVLARLLTPDDFGVVAIVTGFVGVLQGISDAGLSGAAIREKSLSGQQSSNLFWCNVVSSLAAAILAIAAAPLLASFVNEPDVVRYVPVATLAVIFRGLGAQQRVILQRELNFGSIARAEAIAITANAAIAIAMAASGFGVWSIFVANVASVALGTGIRWQVSGWRPGAFRKGHGTRRLLWRGGGLLAATTISSVRTSADSVILGRFAEARDVGLYSKAYGLLMLPMSKMLAPMNRVALPVLVQLWDEPERFRKAYFRLVAFLGLMTTPVTAFLFIGAEEVVLIMLGEQFKDSVPLFRVLALASLGMSTAASASWVQQASGQVARQVWLTAGSTSLVVVANVIGAWLGGSMGMAISWVVGLQLARHPTVYLALKGSPIPYRGFLAAALPGTVVAILGAAAMCIPKYLLPVPGGPIARLGVVWSVGLAVMAVTALAWPRLRQDMHAVIDMVRAVRRSRRPGPASGPLAADPPLDPA